MTAPTATYRLQLGLGLTFGGARDLVPYLAELGISDCYLSPILQPCARDSHGYDVADHRALNEALGGRPGYEALSEALRAHGMGQLVDVVPNHMGIVGPRNAWWQDVLEHGAASQFASFFDIDWEPLKPELRNRVLLPILGDHYGRVLEKGELRLQYEDGRFLVRYHEAVLPIDPRTLPQILAFRLPDLEDRLGRADAHVRELQAIVAAAAGLPERSDPDAERQAARRRDAALVKRRLDALVRESPAVKAYVEDVVWLVNGTPGEPESFDRLDAVLTAQAYRVAYWGVAGDEINYRRFFDINDLAAIRMEDPAVFEAAHRLLLDLVGEGRITGFRIDHPDGLYTPARYLESLRAACAEALARARRGSAPAVPFYVVVEKVLMPGEALPDHWPVHGTTGYEFLNSLNGLFVDPKGARALEQTYQRITGLTSPLADVVHQAKRLITDTTMASELNVLGRRLARLAERRRESRDFTERSLTEGLREIVACFPVYRSYIGDQGPEPSEQDRRHVAEAVAEAQRRSPLTNPSVFEFISDLLCRTGELDFVRRFQQITGPVTAKGVEDTAFYRYTPLLSLSEVGGAPDRFGTALEDFHRMNAERLARWPHSLLATSTHDTKRSEDVRARINVLSELPGEWRARLRAWRRLNRRHRALVHGQPAPDANEECYLYQTLLGAWPTEPVSDAEHAAFTERITQHMLKAVKEAKVHASWIHPSPEYDDAIARFVAAILDRSEPPPREPGTPAPPDRRHRARRAEQRLPRGLPAVPAADRRGGDPQLARADTPEAGGARRAGHLPGDGGVGADPGRSGQPPARGLRAARRGPSRDPRRARGARVGPRRARPLASRDEGGRAAQALRDAPGARVPATARVALRGGRLRAARRSRIAERSRGGVLARARGRDCDRGGATVPRPTPSVGSAGRRGVGRDVARAARGASRARVPQRLHRRAGGRDRARWPAGAGAGRRLRDLPGGAPRDGDLALNPSPGLARPAPRGGNPWQQARRAFTRPRTS